MDGLDHDQVSAFSPKYRITFLGLANLDIGGGQNPLLLYNNLRTLWILVH